MPKMYKHVIICNVLISLIRAEIIPPLNNTATITAFSIVPQPEIHGNSMHKVISGGEGELITHNNSVTLPSNDMAVINLEKNVSVTKGNSVFARKGVSFEESGIKSHEVGWASEISLPTVFNNTNKHLATQMVKENVTLNSTNILNGVQNFNVTEIHKPLRVSSELLAKMDKNNNITIDENESSIRVHLLKAASHPGMILPIVITILVVPMFAVVAYMALKRGQEAWKNRHYKRMDFLLDGMYND